MASVSVQALMKSLQETPNPMKTDVLYEVAIKTGTITAATDVWNFTAHGLAVGDAVRLVALTGGTGSALNTTYWVITVPDANTFTVSATKGGSVLNVTADATAASLIKASVSAASLTNAQEAGIDDADAGRVSLS